MVLPEWIEHTTSPLPRGCSTTELRQRECETAANTAAENAAETATRPAVTQGDGACCKAGRQTDNAARDRRRQNRQDHERRRLRSASFVVLPERRRPKPASG